MKKIFTLFAFAGFTASTLSAQTSSTYNGNGGGGFGGGVGSSALTVTDNGGTTIDFSLSTTLSGLRDNILVIYLDTKSGGVSNNSTFTDVSDGGRTATSGLSSNGRTPAIFPADFTADYAIALQAKNPGVSGSFAVIYDLSTPSSFGLVGGANISVSGTASPYTVTFSMNKADVGLTGSSFKFLGTLISATAYRSNETIGTSVTTGASNDAPNAGFTGTTTFSASNIFPPPVLPLKLVNFSGRNTSSSIALNWVTTNEANLQNFVIEGSMNGFSWNSLITVAAKNTGVAQYTETLTDAANSFYRLKMVDKDGKISYSPIINLKSTGYNIKLINNPVIGSIRLSINADANNYTATVYSLEGRAIATKTYGHPGGVSTFEIPLTNVAKGNYVLRVANGSESKSFSVVVQ